MIKHDVALRILDRTWLTVHLRPSAHGVVLPKHLAKGKNVALQYGYDMPKRIPDLLISDFGISGTLLFGGVSFWTCVPWHAVFAMAGNDGRGEVWPEDAPVQPVRVVSSNKKVRTTPARGVLRLVHSVAVARPKPERRQPWGGWPGGKPGGAG